MCIKAINILTLPPNCSSQFTIKIPSYLFVKIAIRKIEILILQNTLSFLMVTIQTYSTFFVFPHFTIRYCEVKNIYRLVYRRKD